MATRRLWPSRPHDLVSVPVSDQSTNTGAGADKPGSKSLQSSETSALKQCDDEPEDKPCKGKRRCPSAVQKSELQTSLHCHKEQRRRLQITTSCQRLCELLPFVDGQLDTATTLELTAKYINFLQETLPPNVLSEINKAVEKNTSSSWKNLQRSQRKRRTVRLKRNTSQRVKPADNKSNEDNVSERSPQQNILQPVIQPSNTEPAPLTVDQMLRGADSLTTVHAPPILLDKSTVPRGQMLPVCQDQFFSASFQFVENGGVNPTSAFINSTSSAFTPQTISHTFLPQLGPDPSSSHVFWDVMSGLVEPAVFPSVNLGRAYSGVTDFIVPSQQRSQIGSPVVGPAHSVPAEHFTNKLLDPSSKFQSATSSTDDPTGESGSVPVSGSLCDAGLVQESHLWSSSPLTDGRCDVDSPVWLDLLLDGSGNLCLPDANLIDIVLSSEAGSH